MRTQRLLQHSLPPGDTLSDEDVCPGFACIGRRSRDLSVARWPQVLLLQLQRWQIVSAHPCVQRKMATVVSFPVELHPPQWPAPAYRLRAVVVHFGEAGGGGTMWHTCARVAMQGTIATTGCLRGRPRSTRCSIPWLICCSMKRDALARWLS